MRSLVALVAVALLAGLSLSGAQGIGGETTQLVSVSSDGSAGFGFSGSPSISADGRYVAFASEANNFVPNDTNAQDVFLHDRQTGVTELISVATDGTQADRPASNPSVSGDGRYVVFASEADELVPNDGNGESDVFLRDTVAGTTTRVSVASDGTEGDLESLTPSISANGRFVTFTSRANTLAPDDDEQDLDVFIHDLETGVTELVSQSTEGAHGNFSSGGIAAGPARVSADGRYVAFGSFADNLVPSDGNQADDAFIRDRQLGTTERVSVSSFGTQGESHSMHPAVSDDGRFVVFDSLSQTLVADDDNLATDVFLHDRQTGETTIVSRPPAGLANEASYFPAISGDGRWISFASEASNLVASDENERTDVFLFDTQTGALERVSVSDLGVEGDSDSTFSSLSADGATIAYQSAAMTLAPDDSNPATDVFVRGKPLREPTATPTPTRTPTPQPPELPGDTDCNGSINSIDAALVLQLSAGFIGALPCPDAGDVNGNGRTDSVDAALILQFVAGLLDSLPA
ncbi:MAG: dockerin type I domain-containing protein [Dehalococcoidia bacterium]